MKNASRRLMLSMAAATLLTPLMTLTASAQGLSLGLHGRGHMGFPLQGEQQKRHAVFGNVTAVNGTTVTVETRGPGPNGATTTLTIDASAATVSNKDGASSLSSVTVGSMISVEGTVDGSSVKATAIHLMPAFPGRGGDKELPPAYDGDGSPVILGNVTAVSGSVLTVTNKGSVTYSVDASSAKFASAGKATAVTDIAVGDSVMVQGSVNGSSVTATSVIEQPALKAAPAAHHGFFGFFGGLFAKLFGK